MNAPVNVLAVLTTSAIVIEHLPGLPGFNGSILTIDDTEAERIGRELTEARAAVAELIDAAEEVEIGASVAGFNYYRLRAALARIGAA
jgi:hypothetical protein